VPGDPAAGLAAQAPFDVILILGAVAAIPAALPHQLAEGGRLVGLLAPRPGFGQIVRVIRAGAALTPTPLAEAFTAYLPGQAPERAFSLHG
jgi:protein-L-isoaspartate(D-aspartate) O-methyltransferase